MQTQSVAAQGVVRDKISGEILAHQNEKQQLAGIPPAKRSAWLAATEFNTANLEAEECALYVSNKLAVAEIERLADRGVIVLPNLWIPPVAAKHPYGFHLARVSYGSLDVIRDDPRFVRLESTEFQNQPMNDLGSTMINVDDVHNGNGVPARNGSGVTVAVADSGMDLTHGDFPTPVETYDMTTGNSTANWSTLVQNTVTPHGTHVVGTVVGRGTLSGGRYQGSASGASLCFYKIGDNVTGSASDTDMIEAINRAVTVGAKVFTMSYGGFSTYMDGSESVEQAIDSAVASGLTVFISAGNEGSSSRHDSISVPPATTSATFTFTINNSSSGSAYTTPEWIRVIWRDNNSGDYNLALACSTLGSGESLSLAFSGTSLRAAEGRRYILTPNVAAGSTKNYSLTLQNTAASGTTPLVHCYRVSGKGTFGSPDPSYTVGHPAIADSAIAVGAWTQRKNWTDYQGSGWQYSDLAVGTLAPFSSLGPRIDGTRKPDLVAPGAATISARDSVAGLAATTAYIIDNDGLNLNGSGPANYYVMRGTSMACPLAAGTAALLLQDRPSMTPAQIRTALTATASQAASPNNSVGYGLIDALAALDAVNNAEIAGRKAFYNHSAWDGNEVAANASDDAAIATDKTALLPGGIAVFANYTSFNRGLNGIMVDISGLAGTPTASDFEFKMGNDNNPASWTAAPAPASVSVRAGAGAGGSDRVTLIWNDNNLDGVADANEAVAKQWLEVTVKATANTGLAANDVFFFGNAVGDSGNSTANSYVDLADEIAARNNPRTFLNPALIDTPQDCNRDQRVDLLDEILVRNNGTTFVTALKLIDLTGFAPATAQSGGNLAVQPGLIIWQTGQTIWIACRDFGQAPPVLITTADLVRGLWTEVPVSPAFRTPDSTWIWRLTPEGQSTQAFFRLAQAPAN